MAVDAASERAAAGAFPAVSGPAFVGRERELAALAGAPGLVLLEGEAGAGKTRLLREFLASPVAAAGEVSALVATCPPFRQPLTLGPLVDALRQTVAGVAGLRLSPLAGALRPLFPEWSAGLPPAPEPLGDATAARHRLFGALAELLDRLSVTVLVAEDVHWADDATLEFLLFLAARQPQAPALVVTYRPEDVPDGSLLRRMSSRPPGGGRPARITLGPLDVTETADMVSSMLDGEPVSAAFAEFLNTRTEGLPLAVEESVHLLYERADLVRRDGEWVRHELHEIDVPPTIRDAVLERAGRLGSSARAVLAAAAVLAAPAPEDTLTAVSGLSSPRAQAGLDQSLTCGLLTVTLQPYGPGLVCFRHALAARAVYEEIPAPRRRELHLRAALELERTSSPPVAALAQHFREAGDTVKWCQYAEQAADLARVSGDEATATALLHALVVSPAVPSATAVRLAERISLVAVPGHGAADELARRLRAIVGDDRNPAAQRAEARYHLGRILLHVGESAAATAELERAIPGLAHRPVEAARAMILLGWPGRTPWPAAVDRRWLDRAAAAAASSSIPASDRLALIAQRATGLLDLGDEAGWAIAAEMPAPPGAPAERIPIAVCYLNTGDAAMRWGRYEQARQRLAIALDLAEHYNYPAADVGARVTLAHLDWFTGQWAGLAERAAALSEPDDLDLRIRLEAMLVTGMLDAVAGDRVRAAGQLRLILDDSRRMGFANLPLEPAAALARLYLSDGAVGDALAVTDEPMRVITAKGIWLWATDIGPARTRSLLAAGRAGEAGQLVAAFADGLSGCAAPAPHAALTACQAMLAEHEGDTERAGRLFDQAAAAWDALPRPYAALLAREGLARCLLASGQPELERGLALLASVGQGLSGLGAGGDAERVAGELRRHGIRPWRGWRGGSRGYGDQLSPRELEVVRLLVAGRSTRQIADTLCRSPNTVNMQLASAKRKLGASSRTALVARAIEAGVEPA